MKKQLSVILAASMVLSMTACGGSSQTAETTAAAADTTAAAAADLIIIDLHNSAPMQESAYGPDKTHNSYTGRLSYDSPAVHDTARSEAAKAMQVPAGRVQSPCQKAGWGTSDLPAALR